MRTTPKRRSLISGTISTVSWGLALVYLSRRLYRELTRESVRGKVVLVTGGSRGLGLAMARELAQRGAHLVLCARTSSQLEKAQSELEAKGSQILTVEADLRDQGQASKVVTKTIDRFGRIDILINNAGMMITGPENVMSEEDYKAVMDTNLWSALYMTNEVLPFFKQQGHGHIVNICSIGGKFAVPHMLPYSVSKFALAGLSQGLASELAKDNVKVTTVFPNLMRTGSPRNITVKGDHQREYRWFKVAGSLPLLSQGATDAAKQIINGIETGRAELVLTLPAKLVAVAQGIAPGVLSAAGKLANRFLPESQDTQTKTGQESESQITRGKIGRISDQAAKDYNQL